MQATQQAGQAGGPQHCTPFRLHWLCTCRSPAQRALVAKPACCDLLTRSAIHEQPHAQLQEPAYTDVSAGCMCLLELQRPLFSIVPCL